MKFRIPNLVKEHFKNKNNESNFSGKEKNPPLLYFY